MVRSLPGRFTSALPRGIRYSPSGICSFLAYSSLCSRNTTGSSHRMADFSRPLASAPVEGQTTFRPGMWVNSASRHWECWPALRRPAPMGARNTMGIFTWPPVMYRILAAWFITGSRQTVMKSSYIHSTTGRRPRMAMPTAMPVKPDSLMGVSMTRLGPNSSKKPWVMANTLPITAISSPRTTTFSSRTISSCRPSRIALLIESVLILPHTSHCLHCIHP